MKKLWPFILIAFTLGFTSCSDDDDVKGSDDIIGEWILEDVSIGTLEATDSDIKEAARDVYKAFFADFEPGELVEFRDNGTVRFGGDRMKYSTKKNTLILEDSEGDELSFTYKVSEDYLVLTLDMRKLIIDILSYDDDVSSEALEYIKKTLKKFTVDLSFDRY